MIRVHASPLYHRVRESWSGWNHGVNGGVVLDGEGRCAAGGGCRSKTGEGGPLNVSNEQAVPRRVFL